MRINLAFLNVVHNPRKTALSIAGIGIAILLIFMQLGFRGAVERTATNIYGKLQFDILLRSADYLHFVDANQIDRRFLDDAAGIAGVQAVQPLRVTIVNWRNPQGEMKGILLLGVDPTDSPFSDPEVDSQLSRLTSNEVLLMDTQSHPEFGPSNGRRFGPDDIGRSVEVANQQMSIVGYFRMGAGLAANGAALVSSGAFDRLDPTQSPDQVTFGLVRLSPSVKPEDMAALLQDRYRLTDPANQGATSIEVLTREEVMQRELSRWLGETPIGFIFSLGVLIALAVGAAIVYLVLGNDVANRLHEYATLRAMGFSQTYLATVVLRQAAILAAFSFVPAFLLSLVLYRVTGWLANINMEMTLTRTGWVLLLTLFMAGFSGTLALKKLWQAEPAELF